MSWIRYSGGLALAGAFYIFGAAGYFSLAEAKPAADGKQEKTKVQSAQPAQEQPAGEVVEIPLDTIWALDMPGTRDARRLEPDRSGNSLVNQIGRSLRFLSAKEGTEPKRGFAVLGEGGGALQRACAIFVGNEESRKSFSVGSEITVVFFSHEAGSYVHLHQINRRGNAIEVRYRFVPHRTQELTSHFALIPVGKLPVGKFSVKMIQSPVEKEYRAWGVKPLDPELERRVVCKSFSFSVVEHENH